MKPVLRLTRAIEIEMRKLSAGKSKEDTIANSKNKMQEVHDNVSKLIENTKYTFCVITDPLSLICYENLTVEMTFADDVLRHNF